MKLTKVTKNDPLERLAVSLHKSTADMLRQYQAYYQQVHGDEISLGLLVEEMLKGFMGEDKDFSRKRAAGQLAEPASRTARAEPAAPSNLV